ncbi:MAG: hypothetical protein ACLU7D_08380 [Collinsella sp.]
MQPHEQMLPSFLFPFPAVLFRIRNPTAGTAPPPSVIRNPDKQNPELLRLQKLLDNGQLILFYQGADKMRKEAKRYRKKDVTPQELTDGLFLCYMIAKAPFLDLNDYNNVEWVSSIVIWITP